MSAFRGFVAAAAVTAAAAAFLLGVEPGPSPSARKSAGPQRDTLVVLNKSDHTATIVDAATRKTLATVQVGFGPHEAEIVPGGRVVVVSNYGTTDAPGRTLTLIDLQNLASAGTVTLPSGARPHGMKAVSVERLLVTAEGLKELLIVEPLRRTVTRTIPLGRETSHMVVATPDGKRAFVANIGSGSVTAVDLEAGTVAGEIPTGKGAEGLDLRPGASELWVGNREANTISIIDTHTLAVVATVPVKDAPIRIKFTPDGKRALVSCAKSGDVAVFDAGKRKEIHRISLDREAVAGGRDRLFSSQFGKSPTPVGILIAPDGKRAWVSATNADVVSVIDLDRLEVVERIVAGQEPDGLAGSFRGSAR